MVTKQADDNDENDCVQYKLVVLGNGVTRSVLYRVLRCLHWLVEVICMQLSLLPPICAGAVGKTSLCTRFAEDQFARRYVTQRDTG